MDCRYLANAYELFVLGALPDDEDMLVREHLSNACPNCQDGVHQAAVTVYALLATCRSVKSAPKQKAHLMERLKDR
ncbi:MAG TPA: hypothetical protein VMI06_11990 [Terriglobia bacterium]|nr:hypothetical protein [Terriglobia bacterium]